MKKVLILVPSLGMGGMERVCVNYANLLSSHGYKVYLYNLTFDDELIISNLNQSVVYKKNILSKVPNIKNAGVKKVLKGEFRLFSFEKWAKTTNPAKLYKKLITEDRNAFDIEIAFYGGNIIRILTGSSQKNSIKIGWIHASTIESHFHLFLNKNDAVKTYRKMDALLCVSDVVKEKALQLFGNDVNAYTIYNPQNTEKIANMSRETVSDISKDKFTFINASRLDINHKGLDRLLEAVNRLNCDGLNFDVWILGDGKDKDKFEDMLNKSGVSNIKLLGKKNNPYKYMSLADCYICSSRFEGFSMVVAEAILLGLPVISTDISGAREMLGDSEFGLVADNSTDGIYNGMKQLLEDEDTRNRIKQKAFEHKDFLNEESIYLRFEEIIKSL